MEVEKAPDVAHLLAQILQRLPFDYIDRKHIVCIRSRRATSRARARIWSFPKIWQLALNLPAYYTIEVLSQHFDHLSVDDKIRILIHELMHIPKNFSGALIPHRGLHKHINRRTVEHLFQTYRAALTNIARKEI